MEKLEEAKRAILLALEATLYLEPRAPGLSRDELVAIGAEWEPRLGPGSVADALHAHEESGAVGTIGTGGSSVRYLLGRRCAEWNDLSLLVPRWQGDPRDVNAFQAVADALDTRADEHGAARAKFHRAKLTASAAQRYLNVPAAQVERTQHAIEVAVTVLLFEQRLDYDRPTGALVTLFSPGVSFKDVLPEHIRLEIASSYFDAASPEHTDATALIGWSERARDWPRPRVQLKEHATAQTHVRRGFERAFELVQKAIAARPRVRAERPSANTLPFHFTELALQSFRCFGNVVVQFSPPPNPVGQWVLLLGENGAGKSTMLRAIALALRPHVPGGLRADAPFARVGDESKADLAVAILRTTHGEFDATIASTADGEKVFPVSQREDAPREPAVFGYGCQRGSALGGPNRDVPLDEDYACATLFDDAASLIHAETWLRQLALRATLAESADQEIFEAVKRTVVYLLPGVDRIDVGADSTIVEGPAVGRVPLAALSDGYLSMLGWTIDLVARHIERERRAGRPIGAAFVREMCGVVLVDEIDLHLHPRWQTEVVGRLRTTFPRMTFVVTTHNPLTLHGAQPGEVFVLTRGAGGIEVTQHDVPKGRRADQLLTGEWFGLESTLDDDTLDKLEEHRRLLAAGSLETDPARVALEGELRKRLGGFADTAIERVAQRVVADCLDDVRRPVTAEQRTKMAQKLGERLRAPAKTGT